MEIIFLPSAKNTIQSIISFIDELNTEGSGNLWYERFINHCKKYTLPNVHIHIATIKY